MFTIGFQNDEQAPKSYLVRCILMFIERDEHLVYTSLVLLEQPQFESSCLKRGQVDIPLAKSVNWMEMKQG